MYARFALKTVALARGDYLIVREVINAYTALHGVFGRGKLDFGKMFVQINSAGGRYVCSPHG